MLDTNNKIIYNLGSIRKASSASNISKNYIDRYINSAFFK